MGSLSLQENSTCNEIPYGTYEIEIGDSFNEQSNFHILRCKKVILNFENLKGHMEDLEIIYKALIKF